MPNKMQLDELNIIQGGRHMKCSICGVHFTPKTEEQNTCNDCIRSLEELTNGKGDDEDE